MEGLEISQSTARNTRYHTSITLVVGQQATTPTTEPVGQFLTQQAKVSHSSSFQTLHAASTGNTPLLLHDFKSPLTGSRGHRWQPRHRDEREYRGVGMSDCTHTRTRQWATSSTGIRWRVGQAGLADNPSYWPDLRRGQRNSGGNGRFVRQAPRRTFVSGPGHASSLGSLRRNAYYTAFGPTAAGQSQLSPYLPCCRATRLRAAETTRRFSQTRTCQPLSGSSL